VFVHDTQRALHVLSQLVFQRHVASMQTTGRFGYRGVVTHCVAPRLRRQEPPALGAAAVQLRCKRGGPKREADRWRSGPGQHEHRAGDTRRHGPYDRGAGSMPAPSPLPTVTACYIPAALVCCETGRFMNRKFWQGDFPCISASIA
jgi:hypothetical protein